MANPEHVAVVKKGAEAIRKWRSLFPEERLDLEGADLHGADLQNANLSDADLRGVDFREALLQRANLRGAKLQWADLRRADLRNADLHQTEREGADFRDARMEGVRLKQSEPEIFDVFLAHNSADKHAVHLLSERLRQKGLQPWLDTEQIPPGQWFQDIIQSAILKVNSAALFLGPAGLGRWEALELRTFVSQCINNGRTVIPVILPGVDIIDTNLIFLRELNYVQFRTLDDQDALDRLVWGIRGTREAEPLRNPQEPTSILSVEQSQIGTSGERRDAFIAYASADKRFAEVVAESLRRAGITVWIDSDDIPAGYSEDRTRVAGFESASMCVALVGADGAPWQSEAIRKAISVERSRPVEKSRSRRRKLIIPAYLPHAGISKLPGYLRSIRAIDLGNGFTELIGAISKQRQPLLRVPWKKTAITSAILAFFALGWGIWNVSNLTLLRAQVSRTSEELERTQTQARSAAEELEQTRVQARSAAEELKVVREVLFEGDPGVSAEDRLRRAQVAAGAPCEYRCRDDGKCLDQSQVCNGVSDCNDGSDEQCERGSACCVATSGCRDETGSRCGNECCCCPGGATCCPDPKDGCCLEGTGIPYLPDRQR